METLDVQVKDLNTENEKLKRENSKLLIRIHTLEMEVCSRNRRAATGTFGRVLSSRMSC